MDKQLQMYDIAKKEEGVAELPGDQQNPRIIEYHSCTSLKADDEAIPWCSSFVNWVANQAKVLGTNSAAAQSWLKWGEHIDKPQVGDLVILQRGNSKSSGHVGFYEGERSGFIRVFGGNQGDRVCSMNFSSSKVLEYRRYRGPKTETV